MNHQKIYLEELLDLIKKQIIIRHHFQLSHWLIQGPHFLSLHHQFENDYKMIQDHLDELTEHFLYQQGTLPHSLGDLISNLNEKKFPSDYNHQKIIQHVLDLLHELYKKYHAAFAHTTNNSLITTQDLLTTQARRIEKTIWFYEQMNRS